MSPLITVKFRSALLGRRVELQIYTPPRSGRFSTVYLHHGLGNTFRTFSKRTDLRSIAARHDLIVVLPDAGESWGCNDPHDDGVSWESHLTEELVAYVDRHFPTIPRRTARAQAGFSMGGYEAMMFALRHPDRFAAVYGLAGSYLFGHELRLDRPERTPMMMAVAPPGGPYDLFRLAGELADRPIRPDVAFDVGLEDHLLSANRRFHRRLDEVAFPHHYVEVAGKHDWQYVNARLPTVFDYLSKRLDPRESGAQAPLARTERTLEREPSRG